MKNTVDPDWRDIFCGRTAELDAMERAYCDVVAGHGPRCVVVLGDRGMGKTRLVQELYRILTTRYDPDDYWPDASLFRGNNLRVAPDPRDDPITAAHFNAFELGERRLPFLWWGFRLADPEDRNAVKADLASHRRFLTPYLAPLMYARRMREVDEARLDNLKEVGKSGALKAIEAIPVLGWLVSLGIEATERLSTEAKHRKEKGRIAAERAAARVAQLEREEARDAVDATLADLAAILGPEQGLGAIPVVVFVDDAQFARDGGDESTLKLLAELWFRARAQRWPLLLVASHWAVDWELDQVQTDQSFARTFARLMASADPGWQPVQLGKEPTLLGLIQSGLPGLPAEDQRLLLDKADGNPQLLIEIVDLVRRSPAWLTDTGALTPYARTDIGTRHLDLHQLIVKRIESDATPANTRNAIVLSSVQGIEFLCALTEIAGEALGLGAVAPGLEEARKPHRYIADTAQGIAAFVQRAYFEAARVMVPQQLGDPDAIASALLSAADRIIEDPERWQSLSYDEQIAAMGLRATLGESAVDGEVRRKAGAALLSLIQDALTRTGSQDIARSAQLAKRFEQGLSAGRWQAGDFSLPDIDAAREALALWHGPVASSDLAEAMLALSQDNAQELGTPEARRDLSVSYGRLGDIARVRGRLAEAEGWFAQARGIHESLAQELGTPEARRDLSVSYDDLGDIAQVRSRLAEAEDWYSQACALREALAQELGTSRARRDLSLSYGNLGDIARAGSRLVQAEGWFQQARALHEALAPELGTPEACRDLSVSYQRLGDVAQARSRLAEAEGWFEQARALHEALAQELATPQARCDLSASYGRLGDVARARSRLAEAEGWYAQARALHEVLARELGTPAARRDLSVSYALLGDIALAGSRLAEAEGWFQQARALHEALAPELGTPEACRDLSVSYQRLGDVAQARSRLAEAEGWFEQARALHEALAQELDTPQARRDLSASYRRLGGVTLARSRLAEAEGWYAQARVIDEALAQELGTPQARRDLSVSYGRLGDIAQARSRLAEAEGWFAQARALREALAQELGTPEARRDLSVSYGRLGDIAQARSRLAEAEGWFEQARAIGEALAQELSTPEARRDLSLSYEKLGDIARARSRLAEAEGWFEQARAIKETLVQELGTPLTQRDLSVMLLKLASTAALGQGLERAYSLTLDATRIRRDLYAQLQTAESRQGLVESLTALVVLAEGLDQPGNGVLVAELSEAALGPRLSDETPSMVLQRASALAAIASYRDTADPKGAAATMAESRQLFLSVESLSSPMESAAADFAIGLIEIMLGASDNEQISAQLDALERRLMDRLGAEWDASGALFRDQLQLMRGQLQEQEGADA